MGSSDRRVGDVLAADNDGDRIDDLAWVFGGLDDVVHAIFINADGHWQPRATGMLSPEDAIWAGL